MHDPVTVEAHAAVLDWETGLPPMKHEGAPHYRSEDRVS